MCQLDIFSTSIHREIRHRQLGPRPEHQMARAPLGQSSPIRWNQLTSEMPKKYSTYPGHHKAKDMLQKVFENIVTTALVQEERDWRREERRLSVIARHGVSGPQKK